MRLKCILHGHVFVKEFIGQQPTALLHCRLHLNQSGLNHCAPFCLVLCDVSSIWAVRILGIQGVLSKNIDLL